jgi:small subunit ribosomal protein S2
LAQPQKLRHLGSSGFAQAHPLRSRPARSRQKVVLQHAQGSPPIFGDLANALMQAAILKGGNLAVEITMKELLEAGVHFGHQTRRWNPKMKEYIFGERNGIHIIDLQKTLKMFREASRFVNDLSAQGRTVLFVGTKRQAQEAVAEEAKRCGAFFVNHRWLGGTLTNWATLQKSIKRLKLLKAMHEDGRINDLSKKEKARLGREMKHLNQNLEGIENMASLPDAMFVIDSNAEEIAVKEARRMGVPVVSVVDTNCDPDVVDWIIPGNDDALRAIRLFTSKISESVLEGHNTYQQSQVADQKAAADQALVDGVEYVDTSAYEQYEKQEGDFVEGVVELPADIPVEPPAEASEAAAVPETVPPAEAAH